MLRRAEELQKSLADDMAELKLALATSTSERDVLAAQIGQTASSPDAALSTELQEAHDALSTLEKAL